MDAENSCHDGNFKTDAQANKDFEAFGIETESAVVVIRTVGHVYVDSGTICYESALHSPQFYQDVAY